MRNKIIGIVLLTILIVTMFTGCITSTNVRFETDEPGATIFVDGKNIGTSPTQVKISNAIWEDPDITIKKDGYKDLRVSVDKEVKVINLVSGLFLWWPSLLWVYGPDKEQYFELIPEKK